MKSGWLFDNFPFISTETLTLSKIQPTEIPEVIDLINDTESDKYNPSHTSFDQYSVMEFFKSVDAAFNSKTYIRLGIYQNDNLNELVGTVQVRDLDPQTDSCEIGFSLRSKFRGRGIASEAVFAVIKYLFERVDVNRIQASCMAENLASERVLLRCGFTKEGTCREGVYWAGKGVISLSTYSILKKEFGALRGNSLIIREEDLSIVRMNGSDYEKMAKWLTDEKVLKYYEGRDNPFDLQKIIATYQPKISEDSDCTPCIIRENGMDIGYIQYYPITEEINELRLSEYDKPYGMDLFIGEESARGRGLGSRSIRLLCKYLFGTIGADVVVADPQQWNNRSINAFLKCGFEKVAVLPAHELHEGVMQTNIIMHRTAE